MTKRINYELGELLVYEQPTSYIVESTDYDDSYKTPVLTAGKSFILGYTKEQTGIFDKLPVIIFDDFTTATQFVNFPFKVKSSAMKILHINTSVVSPKYIFYRMQIIQFDHSTHKRYWIQQYSRIKVSIPPLSEQERIVSRIEELFSQLDAGVETLKKTKAQLAVYRQAVLKEAFEGLLTASGPEKVVRLGDYIETPRYGTSKKCSYDDGRDRIAVYRIPNIEHKKGRISHDNIKYAQFSESELDGIRLRQGDILIIRSNGSVSLVGRAAMVCHADITGTFAGYLMRLRILEPETLLPKFLLLFLQSHQARIYIENKAKSTSGVHNINSAEISDLQIPLYDPGMQYSIIEAVESRISVCDSIEQTVDIALQQAEAMRQCILKQAFEGRLE